MYANYGQEKKCEICGTTDKEKTYDWASVGHVYTRKREDWKRLCRSCHASFDMNEDKKKRVIKNLMFYTGDYSNRARGERARSAKFTDEQISKIRDDFDSTIKTVSQLAKEYKVSTSTIYLIVKRMSWKHVKSLTTNKTK
jgi:hypothetical protein